MKRFIKRKIHKIFFIMACAALLFGMHLGYSRISSSLAVNESTKIKQGNITVTLNKNGGTLSTGSINVKSNGTYVTLPSPTKDKNDFVGWYTAASGGIKVTSTSNVVSASNHTLYARYQEVTAPVIQGGTSSANGPTTISVKTAGSTYSGVKHYEYYTTQSSVTPTANTTATGTTSGNVTISAEGTTLVYYRTVSNQGVKSNWSASQSVTIISIPACTEEWQCFLKAANINFSNYASFKDAIDASSVTNVVFSNSASMSYLVSHSSLITSLKGLSNYSSNAVPKLLDSTIYTNKQKRDYNLPFYLYNQGTIDSNVASLYFLNGGELSKGTVSHEINRNGSIYLYLKSVPAFGSSIIVASNVAFDTTGYINIVADITTYNSTYNTQNQISLSETVPTENTTPKMMSWGWLGGYSRSAGIVYGDISKLTGNYYPYIRNASYDANAVEYTTELTISKWWVE